MKKSILIFCITIFTFLSCEKNQEDMEVLNSFLNVNYEFNSKTLNVQKGEYYTMIEEKPKMKNEKLNELDAKFEVLIEDVEKAIVNKETNIEQIIVRYEEVLNEIPQIVKHTKEYLITELDAKIDDNTNANEFRLNILRNKLVMAVSYAFEHVNKPRYSICTIAVVRVNTSVNFNANKSVAVMLSSDVIQTIKEKRQIMVNTIQRNGETTQVNHVINDNYAFADITLDSLQKGNYKLNGVVRFYERTGKIDIPFEENFKVD